MRRFRIAPCVCLALLGAAGGEPHHVERLTFSNARNGQPFFSPDGKWLSFVSDRSGGWQVWVMKADGAAPRRLTDHEGPSGWPSWSADGSAIVYYAQIDGHYQIRQVELAGGRSRPLLEPGPPSFRPLLSPDGRRLLFDRYGATEPANHDLFALDLVSGTLTQLTTHPGYDSDARWSPDGLSIVFHSDRDGASSYDTQIYRIDATGSGLTRLTSGPDRHAYPVWSPNGDRIVYTKERDGVRDLWVMARDGTGARRLTHHRGFDGDPIWAPDGLRIVFATDRFGDSRELAVLEVDSRDPHATSTDRAP